WCGERNRPGRARRSRRRFEVDHSFGHGRGKHRRRLLLFEWADYLVLAPRSEYGDDELGRNAPGKNNLSVGSRRLFSGGGDRGESPLPLGGQVWKGYFVRGSTGDLTPTFVRHCMLGSRRIGCFASQI